MLMLHAGKSCNSWRGNFPDVSIVLDFHMLTFSHVDVYKQLLSTMRLK